LIKITDKEFKLEEWFNIKGENDPEEVDY